MLKCVVINIMHQYAPAFIVVCILLSLSFNYTFPLHREPEDSHSVEAFKNSSQKCRHEYFGSSTNRIKKNFPKDPTSADQPKVLENATTYSNIAESEEKNKLSGDDLRHYEQLVIMKKYPYLDLKELEFKFHPSSGKNLRQNSEYAGDMGVEKDPGICESMEDGPNVEILNRGLSGFSIPYLSRRVQDVTNSKLKPADAKLQVKDISKLSKKSSQVLSSLRDDVQEFQAKMSKGAN